MLHRNTPSQRRRTSRAGVNGSGNANRNSHSSDNIQTTSGRFGGASSSRRASVAVVNEHASKTISSPPMQIRSPRNSISGPLDSICSDEDDDSHFVLHSSSPRISPRGSLIPPIDYPSSPRHSCDNYNRSPRGSLVPGDFNRSPRNSLVPDYNRSPRGSLIPNDYNRSPRSSLVPGDFNRSPRNSLVPEYNRSPRHSLVPESSSRQTSPRNSIIPDGSRTSPRGSITPDVTRTSPRTSPRNSLVPENGQRISPRNSLVPTERTSPRNSLVPGHHISPRNSLVPSGEISPRSPRGSFAAAAGLMGSMIEAAGSSRGSRYESGRGSISNTSAEEAAVAAAAAATTQPTRSLLTATSPYRMSVSSRGAQINLGYQSGSPVPGTSNDPESRRASSNVSQVSADDRRHLCERSKLTGQQTLGLTNYGSVIYQLKDANIESSSPCDFVWRAIRIVYKTVAVTVVLVCLSSMPLIMLIMGIQFVRDCPREPNLPIYMVVGGSFGSIELAWVLYNQIRSRRYARLDLNSANSVSQMDGAILTTSAATRALSAALSTFLLVWFTLGNYWVFNILWPEYKPKLYDPNCWCSKTLYIFALVHLGVIYSLVAGILVFVFTLGCCQWLACPVFFRFDA